MVGQNELGSGKSVNGSALHQALHEIFLGTPHMPLMESNKTLYSSLDHPDVLLLSLWKSLWFMWSFFLFTCLVHLLVTAKIMLERHGVVLVRIAKLSLIECFSTVSF